MKVNIKISDFMDLETEAKIIRIHKKEGDRVSSGDILLDIEALKTSMPIKSNLEGTIEKVLIEEGEQVDKNHTLMVIEGHIVEEASTEEKLQKSDLQDNSNYFSSFLNPKVEEITSDITIIGGGPGGYVAAIHGAKLGAKVVLVEKDYLGGTCLNKGCIPTKALVRSAEVYRLIKEAEKYGCTAENVSVNMKNIISRKNKIVSQLVQGIQYLLDTNNVRIVNGTGVIENSKNIAVKTGLGEIKIKTKNTIIATGSKAIDLQVKGSGLCSVITSDQALDMETLPSKITIIGGGIIGMEFAFIYANLGVNVSVVEYYNDVLPICDTDVRNLISDIAAAKGIRLYPDSKVEEIFTTDDGQCIVCFKRNGQKKYLCTDKVLSAVGRVPMVEGVPIDDLGIELNNDGLGIKVNSKMETNIPNIYAIGDVTNKMMLAHVASHQGIVAVNNIMGKSVDMDYNSVPGCIFTDPEIAMVGICENDALTAGLDIEVGKFPFTANGKALALGNSEGFVKLIKEKFSGRILGGTIIGPHASDLIAEIVLAVKNGLTAEQITDTIHAHPTTAEAVHEAALAAEGGAIHFAGQ